MSALRIRGSVPLELELGFADLAALPGQIPELDRVVPGRKGHAVRFVSILEHVGPLETVTHVTLRSGDGGFSASVPLSALGEAVVAYREGDGPLAKERGGPVRFFLPEGAACATAEVDRCANVKDLAEIRFEVGRGEDTRPTNPVEHAALHDHDENGRAVTPARRDRS
jgi:hypothetical protein